MSVLKRCPSYKVSVMRELTVVLGNIARGHGSTDLAALGPYKTDRAPIFPSTTQDS